MSRALILETRYRTLTWIQSRKEDVRRLAHQAKQAAEALMVEEDTKELEDEVVKLLGFAGQIAEIVKGIKEQEGEL